MLLFCMMPQLLLHIFLHATCIADFICTTAPVQHKSFKPEAVQLWQFDPACLIALMQSSATRVQICVMDSRAYAALTPGMETAEELDACTLLVNSQVCVSLLEHCLQECIAVGSHLLSTHLCKMHTCCQLQNARPC